MECLKDLPSSYREICIWTTSKTPTLSMQYCFPFSRAEIIAEKNPPYFCLPLSKKTRIIWNDISLGFYAASSSPSGLLAF
jgi:hypothetical protein